MINKILIVNFIYLFFTISSAHAYLDPGTGSIIVQALIGFFGSGSSSSETILAQVLRFLGIRKKINFDDENNNSQDNKE